jgi:hypothetical protein
LIPKAQLKIVPAVVPPSDPPVIIIVTDPAVKTAVHNNSSQERIRAAASPNATGVRHPRVTPRCEGERYAEHHRPDATATRAFWHG